MKLTYRVSLGSRFMDIEPIISEFEVVLLVAVAVAAVAVSVNWLKTIKVTTV